VNRRSPSCGRQTRVATAGQEDSTDRDRDGSLVIQIFHLFRVTRQQWLLDEERSVRLEQLGQLLRHGFVQPTVEIPRPISRGHALHV
jgi:hypothetical protein